MFIPLPGEYLNLDLVKKLYVYQNRTINHNGDIIDILYYLKADNHIVNAFHDEDEAYEELERLATSTNQATIKFKELQC